jgi:hypothetical protein
MSPSGWVFVNIDKALTSDTPKTTCKYEYYCKTAHLKALPDKETIVPYKICSFDIEASSSHGDFPVPVKTYKRVATNIVDVFMRMKRSGPLTEPKAKKLISRCVLTAFGMDQLENVDLVYPKNMPSKASVTKRIEKLLKIPLCEVSLLENEDGCENIDHLITLEDTFEKVSAMEEEGGGAEVVDFAIES